MNAFWIITLLLCAGCEVNPYSAPRTLFVAGGKTQPEVILPRPVLDPPQGVVIPIHSVFDGWPADYFTCTNLAGPWEYRTDDFYVVTNDDGTTSGAFSNSPPGMTQEFYWIVPVGYPLPSNIVTNH